MRKDEMRQHFSEICEYVWGRFLNIHKLDSKSAAEMRQIIANFAMVAWNMSIMHDSCTNTKKALRKFAKENFDGHPWAVGSLMDIAELKWMEYREDREFIISVQVKNIDGTPKAVACLSGEQPDIEKSLDSFHDFINTPTIQGLLSNIPEEKLEDKIREIITEYNASLQDCADDISERDFPIKRKELDCAYEFIQKKAPMDYKKKILKELLKIQSFLKPLCKNAYKASQSPAVNAIPDIVMTLAYVYTPDTDFLELDKEDFQKIKDIAKDIVSDFIEDREQFYDLLDEFPEPELVTFLAETLEELNLPPKELNQKLTILLVWGLMIASARVEQHKEKYPDFDYDEPKTEEYDFDKENLKVLQLHVKICGVKCAADILVTEDTTFEELNEFLNNVFERDNDHLYRFECDDGFIAVSDAEEIDDMDVVSLAGDSYVGHHLSKSCSAYYLFDYGDEWEHDITVKKILSFDSKVKYPKVLKITGEIPEQYPDWDEEE